MKYKTQVNKSHYDFSVYVDEQRWHSYYYQVSLVSEVSRKIGKNRLTILEIGVGNKIVTNLLRHLGHIVVTMDVDRELDPDIVMALPNVPKNRKYDCIMCCEVLEHMQINDSEKSLIAFSKITDNVIVSVPQRGIFLAGMIRLPLLKPMSKLFSFPFYGIPFKHTGDHYWELGTNGMSENRLVKIFKKARFKVVINKRLVMNTYHHFYLLEKGDI